MAGFTKDAKLELSSYGQHCFKGAVADKYLKKHGESAALLATPCVPLLHVVASRVS